MMSGEVLRTSPEENRAGALRARAQSRPSTGSRFGHGDCRRGKAAPWTEGYSRMNLSPKPARYQAWPNTIPPREMHSISRVEKAAA
jgi:hypothetical protein